MVITEEELRQAWQNGRGRLPDFPPGTRFTPAALDFLQVCRASCGPGAVPAEPPPVRAPAATAPPAGGPERRDLAAAKGQRLVYTAADVPGLLAGGGRLLAVHPSVTVTHAALDLLRQAGVRVIPAPERPAPAPAPSAPAAPSGPGPQAAPEDLVRRVKDAVQARLDRPVDPALLDAVVRRVLAAL